MSWREGLLLALIAQVSIPAAAFAEPPKAVAAERSLAKWAGEYRYKILVDGDEAGEQTIAITAIDDRTVAVDLTARFKFKVALVFTYSYDLKSTEVWKDGRLESLSSQSDAGDERWSVLLQAKEQEMVGKTKAGPVKTSRPDMTSVGWNLAAVLAETTAIRMIDADTGRVRQLKAKERPEAGLRHVKLEGSDIECWLDAGGVLVKAKDVAEGYEFQYVLASKR